MPGQNAALGGNQPGELITPGVAIGGIDQNGNFQYLSVTTNQGGSSFLTFTPATPYRNAALSNVATAIKASAGNITGWHLYNPGTGNADIFFQFFDLPAGNVVLGTTVPTKTLWVPAGGALDNIDGNPIQFKNAITVAATGDIAGTLAPGNTILANLDYY